MRKAALGASSCIALAQAIPIIHGWMMTLTAQKAETANLPAEKPYDWRDTPDNWPKTNESRCELYQSGEFVALDVDGEDGPADYTSDEEAIAAICEHSGRGRNGYTT